MVGVWYRLSLCWKITSTTVNDLRLFKDGSLDITVTNATINQVSTQCLQVGNGNADTTLDLRLSDIYVDDSNSLSDPGNIWVTAKRPNANGTTNGFTTQIGAGGSGYGSGHSPQVNERALSQSNGWSMVGAGSAITEEYNIENKNVGDINITSSTIVDFMGWLFAKALAGETATMILAGASFANLILTSTPTMFTNIAGSTTYPPSSGTDIGIITTTALTTVSLYECGIIIAYIPQAALVTPINILPGPRSKLPLLMVG